MWPSCHWFFVFPQSDRRKSRHHYDSDEKSETRENGVADNLDGPKPKKAKLKEKLNGDTEEGCNNRLSDEFSKSHKSRRKDLSNGDIDEYEKKSKRVSSLDSSPKSSDNKVEEVWILFVMHLALSLKYRLIGFLG